MTAANRTLAFVLSELPALDEHGATVLRLLGAALLRRCHLKVFVCRAAADAGPARHAVEALMREAAGRGLAIDWVDCGPGEAPAAIAGARRGTPADLLALLEGADNSLVIPNR